MAERPVTYVGVAYPWECDQIGHLNVAFYVAKFDAASWNLMARLGVDTDSFSRARRAFAAVDQHLRYQREVLAGDTLTVRSVIRRIGGRTCRFHHEMTNNRTGEVAALCDFVVAYMDLDARRAVEVPAEIVARAEPFLEPEE